ncbi:helix-turn-helix transcriptional regulator [Spirosoma sp. RP8]|uniref:Helix-turn-helix transcriptional regulator n=1 Tax=Spirosoma liriopis TaxID=2937440 RepID=A0ABT0HDK4_9BACT|nr:helix-turn-helix transcriptional regulator [Spirosoma liriopis]MCK8490244.1 helix-turn-helix transcriptional regulator [Spirosoma liriopis]
MSKKNNIPVFELSKEAKAGLFVRMVDSTVIKSGDHDIDIAHRDNSYLLFILQSGNGRFLLDFEEFHFQAPAFGLIRPEQVHRLVDHQAAKGWLVAFDPGLLDPELVQSVRLLTLSPLPDLNSDKLASIHELVRLLYTLFWSADSRSITLQHLLNALVSAVCDLHQSVNKASGYTESRADEITLAFRQLVEQQYIDWKRPAHYAEALHVSVNHLTDTIKQKTGFPVSYWIQHQTMLEAKRLLYHTQGTVKDVAYRLGFSDQHYFSRLFRKVTGHTPIEFRQLFHDLSTKTPPSAIL